MKEAMKERNQTAPDLTGRGRRFSAPYMTVFGIAVFFCMFLFYSQVHPLYIHDFDDWLYVYGPRPGYPDPSQWNPTKVLPEVLMPLVSYIGAYFVYPLTGDYIQALCDTYAVTLSLLIVCYLAFTARLLKKWFSLSDGTLTTVMVFYFLAHFLPFLTGYTENQHLFYSINVTCIFNYLIPALWNFILCLYFLTAEKIRWKAPGGEGKKGLLIFGVYLAIFSSLWHSVILMSLVGTRLLYALIEGIVQNKKEGKKWISLAFLGDYIREHMAKLIGLLCWFLAALMEVTGYRATLNPTVFRPKQAILTCIETVMSMNTVFLAGAILINLAALALALYMVKKDKDRKFLYQQSEFLVCMVLCGVFLVIVASKVGPAYLRRSDVMISWMLWLMLMTVSSLCYLIRSCPKLLWAMPMVILALLCATVMRSETFAEHYFYKQTPEVVKAVSDDIIAQIQAADEAGLTEVEVRIPVNGSDGWPLDTVMTPGRIAQALYDHNLTSQFMDVTILPDPAKDLELHVQPQ